jgi:hypothetical protein
LKDSNRFLSSPVSRLKAFVYKPWFLKSWIRKYQRWVSNGSNWSIFPLLSISVFESYDLIVNSLFLFSLLIILLKLNLFKLFIKDLLQRSRNSIEWVLKFVEVNDESNS